MCFFLYIVFGLLVGLKAATDSETDPTIKGKIKTAQKMTVISWCTYHVVYLFPMLGINAANAVVSIQMGYCASDIISKCGVGLVIYQISYAKSCKELLPFDDSVGKLASRLKESKSVEAVENSVEAFKRDVAKMKPGMGEEEHFLP